MGAAFGRTEWEKLKMGKLASTMEAAGMLVEHNPNNAHDQASFQRNNNAHAFYLFYAHVHGYLTAGHSFCTYMKENNLHDIRALDPSEEIDCASAPPNWKF